MLYEISNNHLNVKINDYGAELSSIKMKNENIEYLWQLDKNIWERQAPLLFPIIGRLKDEEFIYNENIYKINIHGFANTSLFELYKKESDNITLLLKSSENTLKQYPFKFELYITYKLVENSIEKIHKIKNLTNGEMYYEIGGHEGFNLALLEGEVMEDYFVEFYNQNEIKTYTTDKDIMINKDKKTIKLDKNRLYLSKEVFKNDALIIDELKKRIVAIKNIKNNREVIIEFENFKYLGIWTKYMRSNYVCIEPWSSLPDTNYLNKQLVEKQDILKLEKNAEKILKYTITIK